MKIKSAITWFQVPAVDFTRAVKFYSTVLQQELREETMGDEHMGIFPFQDGGVGGAVTVSPTLKPAPAGINVFLLVEGDIDAPLSRVAAAGGSIVQPKTPLAPDMGHFAVIRDTEGNRIGLHSFN